MSDEKIAVLTGTDENFNELVANATTPVIVDFVADWCRPCQAMSPWIEEVAKEMEDSITFIKVNIETSPVTASSHQISSIPTLIVYVGGEPTSKHMGLRTKSMIQMIANQVLTDVANS